MKTKNRRLPLSILATCTLFISVTGCKKNKDSNAPKFSATIGGTAYNSSHTYAYSQQSLIFIEGLEVKPNDSIFLELVIPDTATVNSKLTFNEADLNYLDSRGTFAYFGYRSNSHGIVTFTSWDKSNKKIAGNFSGVIYKTFSTTDSVVFTNGQFNTNYD